MSAELCQDPLGAHSAPIDSLGSGEEPTDGQGTEKKGKGREEETGKRGRTKREKGTSLHFFPLPALAESLMRSRIESISEVPVDVYTSLVFSSAECSCVLLLLHYYAECIFNIFIVFITVWLTFILGLE